MKASLFVVVRHSLAHFFERRLPKWLRHDYDDQQDSHKLDRIYNNSFFSFLSQTSCCCCFILLFKL